MTTKTVLTVLLAGTALLLGMLPPVQAATVHKHTMRHHARVAHHTMRHHRMARRTSMTRTRTQTTASFSSATTNASTPANTVPAVTPSPGVSNVGTVTHGVGTAGNLGRPTTVGTGASGEKIRRTVPVPGSGVGTTAAPNR